MTQPQLKLKTGLLIGLLFIPSLAFSLKCSELATKPLGICVSANGCSAPTNESDWFFSTYSAPSSTLNITLSDYSAYINAALNGEALGSFSIPMCFGAFTNTKNNSNSVDPALWKSANYTGTEGRYYSTSLTVLGTASPTGGATAIKAPLTTGTYYLDAKSTFCQCPYLPNSVDSTIGTAVTCTFEPNATLELNVPKSLKLNDWGNVQAGTCRDALDLVGGMLFNYYAPPGTIPPVGSYTTDVSMGICPPGHTC